MPERVLFVKKINISIFILALLFFFSCRKEIGKPYWDTQLLAPLVKATLDINNLLPDSILQSNADSSMKIVYNNDIYTLSMDTLFKIPDTNLYQGYAGIQTTLAPGANLPIPSNTTTTYQLPGVDLRTLIIKSGEVRYTIKNKIHEIIDFVYSIPCATLNGNQFSINIAVPAAVGNIPGVYSQVYDLSGYTIDLTGQSHNLVNTIYTGVTAQINPLATSSVIINPADSLTITNTFYNLIPYYAKGYFGQTSINIGPAESDFTLFKRIIGGTLKLQNVSVNFKINNPIGIDARMYINNLSSINTRTNSTQALMAASLINTPININRAAESGFVDYPTYANFPLNSTNSNIINFIDNLPDKLGYSIKINTNPLGNVSGSNDFIFSDKLLNVALDMEIPLSLVANNLTLVDTLNLNISNNSGVQNVHSGTITLFANNGFPFQAAMQIYLLNSHNVAVDSILGYTNTIDEAPLNSSLRATLQKLTKIVVPMSESKMNLLYATKKVSLKVKFNTASQPNYIKIYSDYKLDVNLVGDFNYTVHL